MIINESFKNPESIVNDANLSKEQKIKLLLSQAKDFENKQKCTEENMVMKKENSIANQFSDILDALRSMGVEYSDLST